MRQAIRRRLEAGVAVLNDKNVRLSEQRVMRECLRFALKFWRGHGKIARRNRKYNGRLGPYEIMPFYTTEALRSATQTRCHHAGISLSRLMDFAVAIYLPRVIEHWLQIEYHDRDKVDAAIWRAKYGRRRNCLDFVISYKSETAQNDGNRLEFTEKSEILPWPPPRLLAV